MNEMIYNMLESKELSKGMNPISNSELSDWEEGINH